jgi:methionine-R-sulfoxide reductase
MSDKQMQLPETEEGWRERLAPEQYHILREQGTERPFSGELLTVDDAGTFRCAGCDAAVFSSETKFSSKTGWPSFHDALEGAVELRGDDSHGMQRTEVVCAHCGGHLGHVFDDGPEPTGKRYCINSAAMRFDPA